MSNDREEVVEEIEEVEEIEIEAPDSEEDYFAVRKAESTAHILLQRAKTFFNRLESNDHLDKIRNMWRAYHGYYTDDSHEITFTGEQGELVDIPVNHFRNIARHMYTMITANRPIMEARAINSDYKSLAQTYLANGILDYYMREKGLEEALVRAVEMSIVLGAGYVKMEWNSTAGEAYDIDPDTGEFDYEGEVEFTNPSFLDVIVDGTKESWNNEWVMVRSFHNKHNIAAKFPHHADRIRRLETKNKDTMKTLSLFSNDETDDVPVYEFFHKKTDAVPEGRYMYFLESDLVLIDTVMPYKEIPIYRLTPADILGTPYGYTPMFDVFPIQEAINSLYSTILTNQNAFGVQNVYVPRGADLVINSLEGGLNVIEGNAKPEPLNLTNTPQEIFMMLEEMIKAAETLSGVSSVTRGNPEYSLKSGTALAMVQSMSLQFISQLQQNYVRIIEDSGSGLINILKDYAHTPKLVAMVGKYNQPLLKEFTGDQIDSINRVIVDVGNPLSRTTAGRVQMAEQLAQMKLLKNPAQYFQVMNTGRLDVAFEGESSQLMLIKKENEMFLNGEEVEAVFLDLHSMHIQEHRAVMDDPEFRKNGELMERLAKHMQSHINFLRNTDPDILQIIGEQPLNPPQAAAAPVLPPGPQQEQMGQALPGPMPEVLTAQQGPGNIKRDASGAQLPKQAAPPAPFENLPVNPEDL